MSINKYLLSLLPRSSPVLGHWWEDKRSRIECFSLRSLVMAVNTNNSNILAISPPPHTCWSLSCHFIYLLLLLLFIYLLLFFLIAFINYISIYPSFYPSVLPSIYPFISVSLSLSYYLSIYLPRDYFLSQVSSCNKFLEKGGLLLFTAITLVQE